MALKFKSVSATATSQTIGLDGRKGLSISTPVTNEVYIRVFEMTDPEPSAASGYNATTADAVLLTTDTTLTLTSQVGFRCISIVCDAAETATVRLFYI